MNAVNLIPLDRRRSEVPSLPGLPFVGLVATLLLVLAGTFVYAGARERVATRQGELARVQAATAEWSAAASRYGPTVSELKHRGKEFALLSTLLGERADWSALLSQLAGVMPAHAKLSSLSANDAEPVALSQAAATGATATTPGITLVGCSVSQPVVADTMVALRRLSGVSAVTLVSSTRQGGSGVCALPISFSLNLQFKPVVPLVHLLGGTGAAPASDSTGAAK